MPGLSSSGPGATLAEIEASNVLAKKTGSKGTDEIHDDLVTVGTNVSAVKDKTDNLPSNPASQSNLDVAVSTRSAKEGTKGTDNIYDKVYTIEGAVGSIEDKEDTIVSFMEFWSDIEDTIVIGTEPADIPTNEILIEGIPPGAAIIRVVGFLHVSLIRDESGSDNGLSESGNVTIDSDSLYGSPVNMISLASGMLSVDVSNTREREGIFFVGTFDVKDEVVGNGHYYPKLSGVGAIGNSLLLIEYRTGVRVYFTSG